jgi:hypothetical protein
MIEFTWRIDAGRALRSPGGYQRGAPRRQIRVGRGPHADTLDISEGQFGSAGRPGPRKLPRAKQLRLYRDIADPSGIEVILDAECVF